MKKIGVAVIGTGAVSAIHVQSYLGTEDCELRVLCDKDVRKAERLRESMGLAGVDIVENTADVFAREDIDAVSICLPPALHSSVAVAALREHDQPRPELTGCAGRGDPLF